MALVPSVADEATACREKKRCDIGFDCRGDACVGKRFFDFVGYSRHGGYGFYGIFAIGRFAAEHEGVGVLVYCIGNVAHFGACRARAVYHRVEHLGGHYYRLVFENALVDERTLYAGDSLGGYFDAKVAAGYHDSIGGVEDLVEVVDAFLVLYLGDYLYAAVA